MPSPRYHCPDCIITTQLSSAAETFERVVNADVLAFIGPITAGTDDMFRSQVEELHDGSRKRLVVVLETPGGLLEVTRRIADTLRHHYEWVGFYVPNFAMSAGTVLAMSGDAIYMDYYSVLGPIDPQLQQPDGSFLPALGYIEKYNELVAKSKSGELSDAELAFLVNRFDPVTLYTFDQQRQLAISLLEEWLVRYKFKEWTITKTTGKPVTDAMKKDRAVDIARCLSDHAKWHSHGHGISMRVLRDELNLVIEDIQRDPKVADAMTDYYHLLADYGTSRVGHTVILHTRKRYTGFRLMEVAHGPTAARPNEQHGPGCSHARHARD